MPSAQAPIHPLTSIRFPLSCWVVRYHLTVPNPLAAHIPATIPGFYLPGAALIVFGLALGGGRLDRWLSAPGGTALYILAVLALSCLTYKCIELPLNRYFRKKIAGTF